ncbi:DUF3071 domain-containing protein [Gordonia amarae]|nr:septation protein SepH [Gordonia amarae]QHN19735.1 DUF3071 domain-containing protein [Gordonia amarae]QHN24197.1 DUF3071 domain-containing protein [Gordonia amarae]QHN33114.1 DUF3071 domain-containing protein [Gordonia amarae]QHN41838.1 DUF3071 domain-containing protein [Gordonia amarae]
MRELRVVGVDTDGKRVICQDPETTERFVIVADERLRAAARGDLSRLGQIQIEMESSLRPREIQARIRGGASVAEVAAIAGVTMERIERFAHPVLLERQRATELAALSHPLREDGPSSYTLSETVTEAFNAFGHNHTDIDWDAWKGDDGEWVIQLMWVVGHTDCYAHWRFRPGSHGGLTDPLDELAYEITHPELITPRRRLSPVVVDPSGSAVAPSIEDRPQQVLPAPRADDPIADTTGIGDAPADDRSDDAPDPDTPDRTETAQYESGRATPPTPITRGRTSAADTAASAGNTDTGRDRTVPAPAASAPAIPDPGDHEEPARDDHGDDAKVKPRRKSRTPSVPAWEDVLLGVRGNGHS